MFKHGKFEFIPGANAVTVNHEGGLFGVLLRTDVDWADVSVINPNNAKQVLRFLWSDAKAENLETIDALDILAINDGLRDNIWDYVKDGEITGVSTAGKEYGVNARGKGIYHVTDADGKFVTIDVGAYLGRGDMKEWLVGVQHCLSCDPNRNFLVFAGIVDHNLDGRGAELNEQVRPFWDAVLEYCDKEVVNKRGDMFDGLSGLSEILGQSRLGGVINNRIREAVTHEHHHRLVALAVGQLSVELEPFPDAEGPIKALVKIYFDGRLAIDFGKDRAEVLGHVEYFDEDRSHDTLELDKDDIREIGNYIQVASSFKLTDITPERFDHITMRTIITSSTYADADTQPRHGFTHTQWTVLTGTASSLGIPAGDDGWVRILLNAYYLHTYMPVDDVLVTVEKHIDQIVKTNEISARVRDHIKVALPSIIRSW